MTLQEELQINIVMSNYNERSSSYSSNYDYILLDNLNSSSFRSDLKNLKIKTQDNTECKILYITSYGFQPVIIRVRVPAGKISETTKLLLDVYDTSTVFTGALSTGGGMVFDANSDFFISDSGLSLNR